jgi:hypothetical protein
MYPARPTDTPSPVKSDRDIALCCLSKVVDLIDFNMRRRLLNDLPIATHSTRGSLCANRLARPLELL